MKMLKLFSLIVILMIVSIPVYAANEIEIMNRYGLDKVEGAAKRTDTLTFIAKASVDGDFVINTEQIKINNAPFTSCSPFEGEYYKCTMSSFAYRDVTPGIWPMKVELYSDTGQKLGEAVSDITIDVVAPDVEFTSVPSQRGNEVAVGYKITDTACSNCRDRCSGISKIVFRDGAVLLKEKIINTTECSFESTETVALPSVTNSITLVAYDMLGQQSSAVYSTQSKIDTMPPSIKPETFKLYIGEDEISNAIKLGEFVSDIEVSVVDDALQNAVINLSELGGPETMTASSCSQNGDRYICRWDNTLISFTKAGSVSILVEANDAFGFKDSKKIVKSFEVDETAPVINRISTGRSYNGSDYIGSSLTNVTVSIAETGGLNRANIWIDLSQISSDYFGNTKADYCKLVSAGNWICVWENVSSDKLDGVKSILVNAALSTDDVGNFVTGALGQNVIVDRTKPIINNLEVYGVSPVGPPGRNWLVSGGDILFFANVTETSGLDSYADFTGVLNNAELHSVKGMCELTDNLWICGWQGGPVKDGYYPAERMNATIYDIAGNKATAEINIPIYPRDTSNVEPDYWQVSSIDLMPKGIDRNTAPIFEHRAYASIALSGLSDSKTMDISVTGCTGAEGYMKKHWLLNNHQNSTNPIIAMEFNAIDISNLNGFNITCEMQIITLYSNKISNIEVESVLVNVPFYNAPYKELSENIKNEILGIKEKYVEGGLWKTVGMLRKFFAMAEKLCQMINMWRQISHTFAILKAAFSASSFGFAEVGLTKTCLKNEAIEAAGDKAYGFLDKFCSFINCKPVKGGGIMKNLGVSQNNVKMLENLPGMGFTNRLTGAEKPVQSDVSQEYNKFRSPGSYMNIKDNFLLSAMTLCLPGIIYNLDKYRQIKCTEGACMINSVSTGASAGACKEVSGYMTCKYFVGGLFNAFPPFALFQYVLDMLKSAFSDPLSLAGTLFTLRCIHLCKGGPGVMHSSCLIPKVLAEIGDAIMNLQWKQNPFELTGDSCDDVKNFNPNPTTP